jgi:hypothetical protein
MAKPVVYVAVAIILGLAMTLLPTWFFIVNTYGTTSMANLSADRIPFVSYPQENQVESVSSRELAILSISFVVASVVYFLFRRRTRGYNYAWSLPRQF